MMTGRTPGWYAISVNTLYGDRGPIHDGIANSVSHAVATTFADLRSRPTDDRAGYSIYLYHVE